MARIVYGCGGVVPIGQVSGERMVEGVLAAYHAYEAVARAVGRRPLDFGQWLALPPEQRPAGEGGPVDGETVLRAHASDA